MNNKKDRYLSFRMKKLVIGTLTCEACLLTGFVMFAMREQRYFEIAAAGVILVLIQILFFYRRIYKPYKSIMKTLDLFNSGYTLQGIFQQPLWMSNEVEQMMNKMKEMMNTKEMINVSKKQAEYMALQNQINPHFLYNTLEGIRGETLNAGLESVAQMTEALATFFRYTISNMDNLVTLEDELSNIENYYIIQQYRFGERLGLSIEYDAQDEQELLQYRLPKLTLQPIVENSIYHGIERKIGRGNLRIQLERTGKRLLITISDNGLGMNEERLAELNDKINNPSYTYTHTNDESKGGIAMVNVNNRIKLLFGEEYGISIYSTENVGTDVVITLPLVKKNPKDIR